MTVTLLNGDCTNPEAVAAALAPYVEQGQHIKCLLTDPPYGANFVSRRAVTPEGKARAEAIANDGDLAAAFATFVKMWDAALPFLDSDECEMYVFTRWDIVADWINFLKALVGPAGFTYKMMLVWDKGIPGMGDIDSNWGCGHEIILYLKRGRRKVPYRRSSIIAVDKVHATRHIHPTEKPVDLLTHLLAMSTNAGDLVYEPFAGSASTLVAAKQGDRHAVGFEVDSDFYQRSIERLAADISIFDLP